MEDKALVDLHKTISQIHRSQFDERRRYEWRVLTYSLGIYVAVLVGKYTGEVKFPSSPAFAWAVWIVFISLALASAAYLWCVHVANKVNQRFAHAAEDALMCLSKEESYKAVRNSLPGVVGFHWALVWEVVVLVLVAVGTAWILLYLRQSSRYRRTHNRLNIFESDAAVRLGWKKVRKFRLVLPSLIRPSTFAGDCCRSAQSLGCARCASAAGRFFAASAPEMVDRIGGVALIWPARYGAVRNRNPLHALRRNPVPCRNALLCASWSVGCREAK